MYKYMIIYIFWQTDNWHELFIHRSQFQGDPVKQKARNLTGTGLNRLVF